nr:sigma factor-like helix-turn-helix DNA-binding protein [Mangrovihabitans endophyticus]
MRTRHPDMPAREIARRLGVTDRTVRRHLSAAA